MASLALVYDIIARDAASPVLARVGTEAEASGKKITGMAKALGAFAAVDIGYHMVKMAGDFQKQTSVLQTAAGETSKGLATVRKGILDIAQSTGTPWQKLTDGMYTVEKAGYRGAAAVALLKVASQGAAEENANLADVTNAMTSVMASYHLGVGQSVGVMNALKTAAGESKTTMEDYSRALSTVIPIAAANKVGFDQVAGAIATLTQHGTSADEATQELSNTIRNLAAPNHVAVAEMAKLGLSATDVSMNLGKRGLTGTVDLLTQTVLQHMGPAGQVMLGVFNQNRQAAADATTMFNNLPPAARKLADAYEHGTVSLKDYRTGLKALPADQAALVQQFVAAENTAKGFSDRLRAGLTQNQTFTQAIKEMTGGATGLNTVLQLGGSNMDGFRDRVTAVGRSLHEGGSEVEGWRQTSQLLNTKLGELRQTVDAFAIKMGTALLPAISSVVDAFKGFVDWISQNSSWLGPLVTNLGAAALALYAVSKAAKVVQLAMAAMTALADMNPWLLAIGAVAVAAVLIIKNWGPISRFFERMWHDVAGFMENMWHDVVKYAGAVWDAVSGAWNKVSKFTTQVWEAIRDFFTKHWRAVVVIMTGGLGAVVVLIVNNWTKVRDFASTVFNAIADFFKKHWALMLTIVSGGLSLVAKFIFDHWTQVQKDTATIWNAITSFFSGTWKLLQVIATFGVTAVWTTVVKVFDRMKSDVTTVFQHMVTAIGQAWDMVKSVVASPVKFIVNTVYNSGIRPVWNAIAGVLHENSWKMPAEHFAAGGLIRATHGADSVPFYGQAGEVVVPKDTVARHGGASNLMTGLGMTVRHYAAGGVLPGDSGVNPISQPVYGTVGGGGHKSIWQGIQDDVKGGVHELGKGATSVGKGILSGAGDVLGWIGSGLGKLVRGALSSTVGPIIHKLESTMDSTLGKTGAGGLIDALGRKALDALLAMVTNQDASDNAALATDGVGAWSGDTNALMKYAAQFLGVPYVWGGSTPAGFDCSGFTQYVYRHFGVNLPRTADAQQLVGVDDPAGSIGDLVFFGRPAHHVGLVVDAAKKLMQHSPHTGTVNQYGSFAGWPDYAGMRKILAMPTIKGPGGFSGAVGSGVARWKPLVDQVLGMLGVPLSADSGVLNIIQHESGGDPNAVNMWDSNAARGDPSKGLMQTISETFAANAGPYVSRGIFDPLANIYAGVEYALRTYGEQWLANGGNRSSSGGYLGYDTGGWMPPGVGKYVNGTGKPEAVLTNDQWRAIKAGSSRPAGPVMHVDTQNFYDGLDVDTLTSRLSFLQRSGGF